MVFVFNSSWYQSITIGAITWQSCDSLFVMVFIASQPTQRGHMFAGVSYCVDYHSQGLLLCNLAISTLYVFSESKFIPSNIRTAYFNIMEGFFQMIVYLIKSLWSAIGSVDFYLNLSSLHARLSSYSKARTYKKKREKDRRYIEKLFRKN